MARRLVPANAVAALLILSVQAYREEKGKNLTRARISRKSLLKVSGRKHIREAFLEEVSAAAVELGWAILSMDDGLALIEADSARSWTQVSTSRVRDKRKDFLKGNLTEDDLIDEALPEEIDEEED